MVDPIPNNRREPHDGTKNSVSFQSTYSPIRFAEGDAGVPQYSNPRCILWVDAVGGYLVCLADEIVLGQAIPGTTVDVPILADLSRRHAKIRREDGDYIIEPIQAVGLNGKAIQQPTLLTDGVEIQLASNVKYCFYKPHALSATARLDFASRHRTQPSVDAILLMAKSCVLGPRSRNHVFCRNWIDDVVLYRHEGELYCKAADSIQIDEKVCAGRGRITTNSHVSGSDFSLRLEQV